MASMANRANGPVERGIDVGDAPSRLPEEIPVQADNLKRSADGHLGSNGQFSDEKTASEPTVAPLAKKKHVWRYCLSSVMVLLLFSGATLVLLFEAGPSWPSTRSFMSSGPTSFLEDWRQQWYLPLRGKLLPGSQ